MMYNNKAQGLEEGGSFSAIDARKAYNQIEKAHTHISSQHRDSQKKIILISAHET